MKKNWPVAFLLIAVFACQPEQQHFKKLFQSLTLEWEKRFSNPLPLIYPPKTLQDDWQFLDYSAILLNQLDTVQLKKQQRANLDKFKKQIALKQNDLRPYRTDPGFYNMEKLLVATLETKELSPAQRKNQLEALLDSSFAFFESAKQNLVVFSAEKTRVALDNQASLLVFLDESLKDSFELRDAMDACRLAAKDFAAFCKSKQLEKGK